MPFLWSPFWISKVQQPQGNDTEFGNIVGRAHSLFQCLHFHVILFFCTDYGSRYRICIGPHNSYSQRITLDPHEEDGPHQNERTAKTAWHPTTTLNEEDFFKIQDC